MELRFGVGIENAGAFLRRLALGYNGNRRAFAAGWRRLALFLQKLRRYNWTVR